MKKKTVKAAAVAEKETQLKESDDKEADAVARDGKSEADTVSSESKLAVIPSKQSNTKQTRGLDQQFLDQFWKLADSEANNRLTASLEIIKHVDSTHSSESLLTYTVGRLVQGLASNRECARHGYYITLVGILKSLTASRLPNQMLHDAIKNKLDIEGTKKERIDQHVGLVLAYGALLKSGRLTGANDMILVINQLVIGSKIKNYIQPVAFGFLEELCQQVDNTTFKGTVWPLLKPELSLTWENQTFDTLNLLLFAQNKFGKVVKSNFWKENLGSSSISDPECFSELTKLILRHSSPGEHPVFARIASSLTSSGKLLNFWTEHFDPALESPTKTKSITALTMLMSIIKVVDNETVGKLLQKNIVAILIDGLQAKDELNIPSAEKALESIKSVLAKEDASPEAQISIIEQLLNSSDNIAFDKNTRFMATVSPSLKKEAVVKVVDIYRQFVNDSSRTQDRITIIQHLAKLISHPTMQREVDWKASQLVFLATWAYFTPSASKIFATAAKETFHRALDNPCKKLEDLSAVLSKGFDQVNKLVPGSGISDEIKSQWNNLQKGVQKIQKKNRSTKQVDSWTSQVFLVLYLNMGFELLRDSTLPAEIIAELDTCYIKATEKESKKSKSKETAQDPHWLEVVTDILLSLLSRNQHLLRSIVVSVWSLLAEHITPDALQQVLDVIDPSKKDMPLVDADEDDDDSEAESELSDEEADAAEEADDVAEESDAEDEEFSDEMDEEETITDKLRMKIHEALGDSAALTDTESVDIDDLSDGQMENLDKALGSAFQEFRKARPVRKNNNKLPKDQTALMHFRLRCLDLIEVLTDKELSISLSAAAMMPLLSLLEVTVKEPLQKPLMDRTKSVLRKLTNIRRFTDSTDVAMEDLVKLLQILFSKPYAKRALMPYIGEDLVLCCSFILRCTLHLSRVDGQKKAGLANGKEAQVEVDGVYQLYRSNLSKFFLKRDSPVPLGVFSRALVYPWPDAGMLLEPLIEYAFGPTILKNRKLQAVQLLTALFRNSTALSAVGQPLLTKRLHSLLQSSQRVVDEAGADSKPKYLNELFILLRVVLQSSDFGKLKGDGGCKLWEPFKESLAAFTSKGLGKQKDLKKSHSMLAKLLGLALDETISTSVAKAAVTSRPVVDIAGQSNGLKEVVVTTKKKSNRPGDKEKKEAKKRRMAASAQGFADVTFTQVDMADVGPVETETMDEHVVGQPKMKGNDTNGNQLEMLVDDQTKPNKKKKMMKKKDQQDTDEATKKKKRRNKEPVALQETLATGTSASPLAKRKKKIPN